MNRFRYACGQAVKQLKRNKGMTAASVFAITAMMLILGLFFVMIVNTGRIADSVRDDYNSIEVFYLDKTEKTEIMQARDDISKWPNVKNVKYRSKDQAMKILKKRWGDSGYLLDSLTENPLPDSLVITVKDIEKAGKVAKKAESLKGTEDIRYYKDTVDKLIRFTNGLEIAGIIIIIFLIIISIVVVSNTIKLTVQSRSEEISIMKYVGATDWFIRGPFMLEGVMIGTVSAVISAALVAVIYGRAAAAAGDGLVKVLSVPMVSAWDLSLILLAVFLVMGAGIGALGSMISMRRFLNV